MSEFKQILALSFCEIFANLSNLGLKSLPSLFPELQPAIHLCPPCGDLLFSDWSGSNWCILSFSLQLLPYWSFLRGSHIWNSVSSTVIYNLSGNLLSWAFQSLLCSFNYIIPFASSVRNKVPQILGWNCQRESIHSLSQRKHLQPESNDHLCEPKGELLSSVNLRQQLSTLSVPRSLNGEPGDPSANQIPSRLPE